MKPSLKNVAAALGIVGAVVAGSAAPASAEVRFTEVNSSSLSQCRTQLSRVVKDAKVQGMYKTHYVCKYRPSFGPGYTGVVYYYIR